MDWMGGKPIKIQKNRRYVLRSRPVHLADVENFKLERCSIPKLIDGEALASVEMVALSAWQGMRAKDFKNFIRPFRIGELISCDGYARIIESRNADYPVGAFVVGRFGWQDFAVIKAGDATVAETTFKGEEWLTALSSPGQTPYLAFSQVARPDAR